MEKEIVKLLTTDDGDTIEEPTWCLSYRYSDSMRTLCGGCVYGIGEGTARYEKRRFKTGVVDCPNCIRILNELQKIKL